MPKRLRSVRTAGDIDVEGDGVRTNNYTQKLACILMQRPVNTPGGQQHAQQGKKKEKDRHKQKTDRHKKKDKGRLSGRYRKGSRAGSWRHGSSKADAAELQTARELVARLKRDLEEKEKEVQWERRRRIAIEAELHTRPETGNHMFTRYKPLF